MNDADRCSPGSGCGGDGMDRRNFIRTVGWSSFIAMTVAENLMAGPFESDGFEKLVPADKKLHRDWVKSLFDRGKQEVFRGPELANIGMPIGGIACGQLYLGGEWTLVVLGYLQIRYNH